MKKIIIALLAVMATVGCANDTAKYAISGTGLEDGAQVLLVDQITGEAIDTAVVANGAFAFKGTAPKDAYLQSQYCQDLMTVLGLDSVKTSSRNRKVVAVGAYRFFQMPQRVWTS